MMNDAPSIIDPVTGLPLDQFSGIIQQIPLGSQVFPFEDLNADGRMTRQPIYGDDILPTSALVVGQDTKGVARAGTMDTARRLWTREAVFQTNGAAIPDGTTAPIDVNVIGGGSGGGISPAVLQTTENLQFKGVMPGLNPALWGIESFWTYLYGLSGSVGVFATSPTGQYHYEVAIGFGNSSGQIFVPLWTYTFMMVTTGSFIIPDVAAIAYPMTVPVSLANIIADPQTTHLCFVAPSNVAITRVIFDILFLVG